MPDANPSLAAAPASAAAAQSYHPPPMPADDTIAGFSPTTFWVGTGVSVLSAAMATVHGYQRNKSAGWAIAWGLFGALMPPVAIPYAIYQGLGKPSDRVMLKTIEQQIAELENGLRTKGVALAATVAMSGSGAGAPGAASAQASAPSFYAPSEFDSLLRDSPAFAAWWRVANEASERLCNKQDAIAAWRGGANPEDWGRSNGPR